MKIVHVSLSNRGGGAEIAAMRHSEALRMAGFDSTLISLKGINQEGCVILGQSRWNWFVSALLFRFIRMFRDPGLAWDSLILGRSILGNKDVAAADIVILHYINGFLNYKAIKQLLKSGKHVIWFMHDMWPLTGGCHHALECKGYMKSCKNCPQLSWMKCLSTWQFNRKKGIFLDANWYAVSPSRWLAERLRKSTLFGNKKILVCPNVLNTDIYTPLDKKVAREKLGLDMDKKYILFGAAAMSSAYKGMSYVYKVLERLDSSYEFIVLGNLLNDEYPTQLQMRTHELGFVCEDEQKHIVYSAADAFLITSVAENYPNMVIESMASGTPVVAFSTGGIVEQIKHKRNGYLAPIGDVEELLVGIDWILSNNRKGELSDAASDFVQSTCSYNIVEELYEPLLKR